MTTRRKMTWICWLNDIILLHGKKSCTSWGWWLIPLFTRFYTSQVVQDFWTINSISCSQYTWIHHPVLCYANQIFEGSCYLQNKQGSKLCCQRPIPKYKRYKWISQIIFSSASNYPPTLQPELKKGNSPIESLTPLLFFNPMFHHNDTKKIGNYTPPLEIDMPPEKGAFEKSEFHLPDCPIINFHVKFPSFSPGYITWLNWRFYHPIFS